MPRDARGRFIDAVIVGVGKFGGRELSTGSDLDLFVVFDADGMTDGPAPIEAAVFYHQAVETLQALLGDITAAGIVFPVDLRLRPGSKGSGFAASLASHGAVLSRVGGSLGAADPHAGAPRGGRSRRSVAGCGG